MKAFLAMIATPVKDQVVELLNGGLKVILDKRASFGDTADSILLERCLILHYSISALVKYGFFDTLSEEDCFLMVDAMCTNQTLPFLRVIFYQSLLKSEKVIGNEKMARQCLDLIAKERDPQCINQALMVALELRKKAILMNKKQISALVSDFIPICDESSCNALLNLFQDSSELLVDLCLSSLRKPLFVEASRLKVFVVMLLSAIALSDASSSQTNLDLFIDMVVADALPFSVATFEFYGAEISKRWPDSNFLQRLVRTVEKSPRPLKVLQRCPLAQLQYTIEGNDLFRCLLTTLPVLESMELLKQVYTPELCNAFNQRIIKADLTVDEMVKLMNSSATLPEDTEIDQTLASKFFELSLDPKHSVLQQLSFGIRDRLLSLRPFSESQWLEYFLLDFSSALALFQVQYSDRPRFYPLIIEALREQTTVIAKDAQTIIECFARHPERISELLTFTFDSQNAFLLDALVVFIADADDIYLIEHIVLFALSRPVIFDTIIAHIKDIDTVLDILAKSFGEEFYNSPSTFYQISRVVSRNIDYVLKSTSPGPSNLCSSLVNAAHYSSVMHRMDSALTESDYLCLQNAFEQMRLWLGKMVNVDLTTALEHRLSKEAFEPSNATTFERRFINAIQLNLDSVWFIISAADVNFASHFTDECSLENLLQDFCNALSCQASLLSAKEVSGTMLLDHLPSELSESALGRLVDAVSPLDLVRHLNIRSDFLSYIVARLSDNFTSTRSLLLLVSHVVLSTSVSFEFWSSNITVLDKLLAYGLDSNDPECFNAVCSILCHYLGRSPEFLSQYTGRLFDLWMYQYAGSLPAPQSAFTIESLEMLSQIARTHMSHKTEDINQKDAFSLFQNTENMDTLLAVRFYMIFKIDPVIESLRMKPEGQLFPVRDFETFLKSGSILKRLVSFDIMMSYIEGSKGCHSITELYLSVLEAAITPILDDIIEMLGWYNSKPMDLSQHEFVHYDADCISIIF